MKKYQMIKHKLKELLKCEDTEIAHIQADLLLCELLEILGYEDVVEEYSKIKKSFS